MYIPDHYDASSAGQISTAARVRHDMGPAPSDANRELQRDTQPLNLDREHRALRPKNAAHTFLRAIGSNKESHGTLRERDTLQSTNTTIGVVVGVLLAVFLVGAIYFCFRYRKSIRLSKRRKHRHHHHRSGASSKGSNASQASDGPAPAPPPAPPPAPEG